MVRVSSCFFCDGHLCQVSRTLLLYFQRCHLFSFYPFSVAVVWHHHWSNLHNRQTSISLKRKKIFQKEKRHSSVFWKAFQLSRIFFCVIYTLMISFYHHSIDSNDIKIIFWCSCSSSFRSPDIAQETGTTLPFSIAFSIERKWFNAFQVLKWFSFLLRVNCVIFARAINTDVWQMMVEGAIESQKNSREPS